MSTVLPPPTKRQKREAGLRAKEQQDLDLVPETVPNVLVKLKASDTGELLGGELRIPGNTSAQELGLLVNKLLQSEGDKVPYTFSLITDPSNPDAQVIDITSNIYTQVLSPGYKTTEDVLTLVYTPQAVFRVRAVTRCSASISGHGEAILTTQFSPASSSRMVSGSGDGTARIWDCATDTPVYTLSGHKSWVLCVSWSPDAKYIATGSMDSTVRLWDPKNGKALGDSMKGHTKWVTALAWEPYHKQKSNKHRIASSSKDQTIRIWDATLRRVDMTLSSHTAAVTSVKWGGAGWIYSSSQDRTVKVWNADTGQLVHTLKSHAHRVNHLALSSDFAIRTAYYDYSHNIPETEEAKHERALARYLAAVTVGGEEVECMVSASDDNTMFLWSPSKSTRPIARMTGHQKEVNHVTFSPDGRIVASASFDKSVKLWNARDGVFITTLRGHVAPVYQCAFSADSRLLVSSSKDTTLKLWDVRTGKLSHDLPGHADEVYAVDWSPDGRAVASGGRDKAVRLWKH